MTHPCIATQVWLVAGIFLPQTALRLLVQDNSAGAEVPRIFSFAFSWLRNLYKVSEMHIFYVRWASPNQKGKLLSLYFCCLMYKTAPSLLREVAFIREDSINSGSQWCPKEVADILFFLSMSWILKNSCPVPACKPSFWPYWGWNVSHLVQDKQEQPTAVWPSKPERSHRWL